ncbi:aromatic ring-hydroxylating dioxygenase subunit alpha [Variovorax sp. PBS-H4]|uniref:aromatic ring-hydroxylating dioxygenase subunit alpha n=1 Tax=Variovorax sp. PBS-H4 TaxID=434008 RepID=UPI0013A55C77|nr:aromatic ring-hydroxylating dioxygenase subunit alpha [Variovorax sp. PBS-H4]
MFLRNCWYVVAWDHEIPADGLFNRTVIGEPLLLFRRADGTIVALEDRCCHRLAPLSKGRKEGDCVRCGYHGLKFDAEGICIEVPGLDSVPPRARVRSYPVALRHAWVFVWMGDPALADQALLPDNFSCDHPGWRNVPGYLHYDTPYLLICDNLLDFSHLSYVHEKTLGGSTAIAQARPVIDKIPRGLRVTRKVKDVPPPAYWARARDFGGNHVDRWFIYDFVLPGTLLMHSGGRPAGDAEGDMRRAVELHSCQTLTPETETSTHYFFQQSHRAELGGEWLTQMIHDGLIVAFNEDRDMITAQARNIERAPEAPMLPLAMDAALVQFRRLLAQAIDAERA